ncbi:MAG: hypothetical protein K2X87_14720 [Gemmataceae bacterium]|nr:hypothetical protein [Gemmataceae bacterium]
MSEWYNPIVRTFNRYRVALRESAGLPRERVVASARLDALIPRDQRRAVWAGLRARGLETPDLELSTATRAGWTVAVLAVAGAVGVWVGNGWAAAAVIIPACYVAFRLSRPWAKSFPPYVRTVGELTVYGTRFADHAGSGYRWSHADILLKVRLAIAEMLGRPPDQIRRDSKLFELFGE